MSISKKLQQPQHNVLVTGGDHMVSVPADKINLEFVLGNKVMVGTVNAAPADFRSGVDDLIKAEAIFPGWLGQLLTTPVQGLENYDEMIATGVAVLAAQQLKCLLHVERMQLHALLRQLA